MRECQNSNRRRAVRARLRASVCSGSCHVICTAPDYGDEKDLLLLMVVDQSETIFASSSSDNASDSRQCGFMSEPCILLNVALPNIIPSAHSNLLIDKSAEVTGEASAYDVSIKSLDAEGVKGVLHLNCFIESKTGSLFACSSRVKVEFLTILLGSAFSSSHTSLLSLIDGNLSIADTEFAQEDSCGNFKTTLNFSVILVENGRLSISRCTFASLRLSSSCVEASGRQYISCPCCFCTHQIAEFCDQASFFVTAKTSSFRTVR
ncbi:uncharacterized protein MONOS_6986 [Monocercomonoides exilis]|uniref:uncharacterized protein n=1 Tax=Monocercomonoides exilis TaxID=2049356 RepID=UPI00355947C6|nr:hypothetical protein MONOS_6986 [Monocercomonoides exilis]|eukprot:MONOS_6986.1-p1 / transcript=MONOS_6986.1 / gene=MONOS_6986 / organism=Monocercomonoides_exilis_PA203 / gene_product=unspecified product / transcript_product=unspecified product / location=Mono_scaffold00230:19915-20770(+) / protein_length=263 / sequence_SO=supercontig / SO=protein_coding / is_pseudo=false